MTILTGDDDDDAAAFCGVHFFGIMPAGGFKASLNCDWVDEFDRSARSLASKT